MKLTLSLLLTRLADRLVNLVRRCNVNTRPIIILTIAGAASTPNNWPFHLVERSPRGAHHQPRARSGERENCGGRGWTSVIILS